MKRLLLGALAVTALLALILAVWVLRALSNLPDVSVLKHYRPAAASEVYDRNGHLLTQYYDRKLRIWVPITSLPDIVIHAVVTAEDDTFFGHKGVNYKAVWDAFRHDVEKGRFARGGSTITQQMIKNVLLTKKKTLTRKIREFVLARRAEEILTKRQILEIYLNEVEWGENIYGIEAASRYYFDRHASELNAAQAALLAGMLPNPRYYNPFRRPDKARERQEQVLFNMHQAKILTDEEYQAALAAPPGLRDPASARFDFSALKGESGRPCWQRALEKTLLAIYGDRALYRQGLRIGTTLDKPLQESIAALDSAATGSASGVPDEVLVLKEGGEVRALSCGLNEERARFLYGDAASPSAEYGFSMEAPDAIPKDRLIAPEVQAAPPQ